MVIVFKKKENNLQFIIVNFMHSGTVAQMTLQITLPLETEQAKLGSTQPHYSYITYLLYTIIALKKKYYYSILLF